MKNISFRLSDEDYAAIQASATHSFLPVAAFLRKLALEYARANGLLAADAVPDETPAKVARRPIPTAPNAWRTEMMNRADAGESIADIAASYGVSTQMVKDKIKAAREDSQYHADAAAQAAPSELVYNPVDPDYPTEEEQAINAEIARRKLVAMGFKL